MNGESDLFASPAVANGVVYVGSDKPVRLERQHRSTAVEVCDGDGVFSSSPAVANGVVYIGRFNGNLYAFNASTGALLWQYATGGYIESSPAVANGVVYVGSDDYNLYALNASTGALLWKYTTGESIDSSPAVANGVVYFGSTDNNLYARMPVRGHFSGSTRPGPTSFLRQRSPTACCTSAPTTVTCMPSICRIIEAERTIYRSVEPWSEST